jgi:thioredoxin reductase
MDWATKRLHMGAGLASYDVIIVGGGPAGLSAALVLGRARRRVLVLDEGKPRNAAAQALHGFLSRDGIAPSELLRISHEQLEKYETIHLLTARVEDGVCLEDGFEVITGNGQRFRGRKLMLATGVVDALPSLDGFWEFYGRSVFHCPYCDGWEVRDQPLAVYGQSDERGGGLALELLLWSRDVVLCTDGPSALTPPYRKRLARHGVALREERIARLEGRDGILERIVFTAGRPLERRALFFASPRRQATDLAKRLGCEVYEPGGCRTDKFGRSNVPGLYVIGDASRDVMQAVVAAGEGAEAAAAVNTELLKEDLR